ncbi:MAG: hypothetical protein AAGU15_10885 [Anaerolineaceae bacterium]
MRKSYFCVFTAIVFIIGALLPTFSSAQAQTPPPPRQPERQEPCLPGQPCKDENGDRFIIPTEETLAAPNAIGDSDDYGYTLTSTAYSWIDASSGTNTGINSYDDITAAIPLPFPFPFYENNYSQLYITGAGILTFFDYDWINYFSSIPDESEPNNFISVLRKSHTFSGSAVYYKDFGSYFVIEWFHLLDGDGGVYTFEAILYPTGNIKFQYKTMPDTSGGYWCSTSGIENATGQDGLAFWDRCNQPTNASTAVIFTKPGPSARVSASPLYLGGFTYSLGVDDFSFTLANNGDLGADTYDMVVTTAPLGGGWNVELFDTGGVPLTDTDADGTIDSGSLAQGASKEIVARVSAPAGLSLGAAVKTYIDISSSLNTATTKTVTIESTVPAAFAQTYRDQESHTVWTDLNWPVKQVEAEVSIEAWNINEPTIIETSDHNFLHVWMDYQWGQTTGGAAVHYALVNHFGQVIEDPAMLSPIYDVAGYYTDQYDFVMAAAPDGKIGVVWTRRLTNSTNQNNYNTWFAILNSSGTIAFGPVNLTNNYSWGSYSAGNRVELVVPDISASDDNRFFITWEKYVQSAETEDIYYTIRQSSGVVMVQPTAMTASVPGSSFYYPTTQIALSGNRFYITYEYFYRSGQYLYRDLLYRVFDSSGGTLVAPSDLNFYAHAGVQLSGGNIFLASMWNDNEIRYQIRNGTTYALIYESGALSHPSTGNFGYSSVGVTKDANNRAILTWSDADYRNIYYAYVQGTNGALLSGPVISQHTDAQFSVSFTGSGLTTNTWSPTVGIDLIGQFSSNLFGAAPGGTAMLQLWNSNVGTDTAEFPELTLTLPAGLTYDGDTSGITPDMVGSTVVWQLPQMAYGSSEDFVVYLAVDGATPVPSFFDVSLELSSEGVDVNPADNTDTAQVMVGLQVFLPLLLR